MPSPELSQAPAVDVLGVAEIPVTVLVASRRAVAVSEIGEQVREVAVEFREIGRDVGLITRVERTDTGNVELVRPMWPRPGWRDMPGRARRKGRIIQEVRQRAGLCPIGRRPGARTSAPLRAFSSRPQTPAASTQAKASNPIFTRRSPAVIGMRVLLPEVATWPRRRRRPLPPLPKEAGPRRTPCRRCR